MEKGNRLRVSLFLTFIALAELAFPISSAQSKQIEPVTIQVWQESDYTVSADAQSEQTAYNSWLKDKSPVALRQTSTSAQCSCVLWARAQTGFDQSVGYARNWPVTSKMPRVGAIVVTSESWAGHVAIVASMDADNIYVNEANYDRCRVTYGRAILINSKLIKGYNSP